MEFLFTGQGKIVAFVVGNTLECAKELYNKTEQKVGNIERIYTDGNSMYKSAFSDLGVSDLHIVAPGKSETHMIEAINSSIRDNLARFNRRSKRFSRTLEILNDTLLLFFNTKKYNRT